MTDNNVNKILYTPEEIHKLNQEGKVTLIDVRDEAFYNEFHIDGSVNIPEIFYFLSMSSDEDLLTLQSTFGKHFSEAGVSDNKLLIFYEDSLTKRYCGSCRGYLIGRYLGHPQPGILYGGLDTWKSRGFPVSKEPPVIEPTSFQIRLHPELIATKKDVLKAIDDSKIMLLDDRDEDEWTSQSSSPYGVDFAPRKGHIPGAVWIEWRHFMELKHDYPAFKSNKVIQAMCQEKGITPDKEIIIYCFKGSRASNTYVALTLAGYKKVRVYFASWNEWSRDPDLPISTDVIE